MSGGSSNKQTTASSSEPWKAAQPALQQSLTGAMNIAGNPGWFEPYKGSTVVPWDTQTQQGMGGIGFRADHLGNDIDNNYNMVNANAKQGGLNDIQRGVVGRLTDQATGQFDVNSNPGFQSVLKQSLDSAGNAVNMNAAAAGRYGSGTHQGVAGKTAGDITGNLVSQEYNDFKNRRDAANSGLFNAGQQQQSNINTNNNALLNAYQNTLVPFQDKINIGGMNEDLATRQLNDQIRIQQGMQQAPKSAVEWLNAISSGAGSLGGTQGSTAQGPKANPFGQVLGGLLGVNSLFG